jgi:hypothetical protein
LTDTKRRHLVFDSDDHLSEDQDAVTDQYGNFFVEGSERELIGKTDPYLLVEHNCEDPLHPLEKVCRKG